jgi:NADH-quinone oxidoreductase subunit C
LYGVFFRKHPDLRKILTDYGFNYHPLRKDFPLSGYREINYSEKEKRIVHSNVEILQVYRAFSFKNLWLNKEFFI